jgi:large subunit ribosomal protein L13
MPCLNLSLILFLSPIKPELLMTKTYLPPVNEIDRKWYVVDAADQRLGRLAVQIAEIIRGKTKPTFTPHLDTGDFVIVVNAEKVRVTGKKGSQKLYRRHSGRPGGMKTETFDKLQARIPERIIETAVKGMLPKNSLGRQLFTKLKVYAGPAHPHSAQQPETLVINTIPGVKS